jgi:hypothetical protein
MDTLRGYFGGPDAPYDTADFEDEAVDDTPPPQFGTDERRMQVRAYNFWAGLLDNQNYPSVEAIDFDLLPDFGPHGVLLDFTQGIDDPAVSFIGAKLAEECNAGGRPITRLSDVPARSLLSRITDHYMQILANQAPIGFEAEFVNQHGATILYRGILLPFSSDDDTIDFIFGVINWKELAEPQTTEELLLEINQVLVEPERVRSTGLPMADWADGPGTHVGTDSALPVPSFGLDDADYAAPIDFAPDLAPLADADPVSEDDLGLADRLALAREVAIEARSCEDRTRGALYDAIGRAHDFALAAGEAPDEFAEIVADAGLTVQDRAPMTPVVKLVFGADYDKTRLTEYASALMHARRLGLGQGELGAFLRSANGGLKGVVAEERRLRRGEEAQQRAARKPGNVLAGKLRKLPPVGIDAIASHGEEFALVMIRRTGTGTVEMLGEVPADAALVERAARKLVA